MFGRITQFHEDPRLIALAQRPLGRLSIWLAACLLLLPSAAFPLLAAALAVIMIWPGQRLLVLSCAAPLVALQMAVTELARADRAASQWELMLDCLPAAFLILAFIFLCYLAAKHFQALPGPIRRHPQVILHGLVWCIIALSWLSPPEAVDHTAWRLALPLFGLFPFILWRCGYILLSGQRGTAKDSSFAQHLFYAMPLFGGTATPYGKGHDHLMRAWAKDPESLAKAQLAGLKLLILYWLWIILRRFITMTAYGQFGGKAEFLVELGLAPYFDLGLTPLDDLVLSVGTPTLGFAYLGGAWASLVLSLILDVLNLAIMGHIIIGVLRLFGFNVFRNTYKPLLAESVVEFWNRYYYYFKELLLEFFFYPVYARFFRRHQKIRIFAATMAAACIGNSYYHLIGGVAHLQSLTLTEALAALAPRAFYTLLLGLGIYASMLAEKRRRGGQQASVTGAMASLLRLRRIAGVWLFFALIGIWNTEVPAAEFVLRSRFFLSLFGIDL